MERRKGGDDRPRPTKVKPAEIRDQNPQPVADEAGGRPLPRLQSQGVSLSRRGTSSETTLGWVFLWVAIGLGALLIVAIIWFGGGCANGDDRMPEVRVPGLSEIRNSS